MPNAIRPPRLSSYPLENCAICQHSCNGYPEGDSRYPKVVLETGCHHFFHDLCVQKFLSLGVNDNCPSCGKLLDAKQFTIVKLGNRRPPTRPVERIRDYPYRPVERIKDTAYKVSSEAARVYHPASPNLFDLGVGAAKFVGDSLFSIADFVWPTVIDHKSVEAINREVDRVHDQINKKVRSQQDTMKLLLGQVASIGQDRSRNPNEMLNEVKKFHAKLASQSEKYLNETQALIKKMETLSRSF